MQPLPPEISEQVFLNLPFVDLQRACQVNREARAICESPTFWRNYLAKNYLIRYDGDDPRRIVLRAQQILNGFFARGAYPSHRVLEPMVKYLYPEEIEFEVNNFRNTLVTTYGIQSLPGNLPLSFPNLVVPPPQGNINLDGALRLNVELYQMPRSLTRDEHQYIARAIDIVSQPNEYFTPRGLITIPYDVELAANFTHKLGEMRDQYPQADSLGDFLFTVFSNVETYMYLRYAY